MIKLLEKSNFIVKCCDGAAGLLQLPDNTIKLLYGSPPYPNAVRDYGIWESKDYINKIAPFIDASISKLKNNGFIVINVKANREKASASSSSKRSLVIERLAILMEERWKLYCVDIEIWAKENPVTTGLRVACQDAYEMNLWFSKAAKWSINIDAIRRPYTSHSVKTYNEYEYKPRSNGLSYVRESKKIKPNPLGALPKNIISGGVSSFIGNHQAVQPLYLPEKYIKAVTDEGDLVVDPWMGTGTTGVAALLLGRRFIGFDLDQSYIDSANTRLSAVERGKQ